MLAYARDGAGGARVGDAPRRGRHLRQGARDAERRQRDPVAGHRLARRPRPARRRRAGRRRRDRRRWSQAEGGTFAEQSWTGETALRRDAAGAAGRRRSAPRPSWPPAPATTPASWPPPASRPRCCSCATRPGCRIRRPSSPSAPTAWLGVDALVDRADGRSRRDRATSPTTPGCRTGWPATCGSPSRMVDSSR